MKKILKFEVDVDENQLPTNIHMHSDGLKNKQKLKALMVSAWDSKLKETLRVDVWTKDMPVHDMFIMYHQTLIGMAHTLEKSTGESKLAEALKDYCDFFAQQTKIKNK